MRLEDLISGSTIVVEPSGERLNLISVEFAGDDAVKVVCRYQDNRLDERVFYRTDEPK